MSVFQYRFKLSWEQRREWLADRRTPLGVLSIRLVLSQTVGSFLSDNSYFWEAPVAFSQCLFSVTFENASFWWQKVPPVEEIHHGDLVTRWPSWSEVSPWNMVVDCSRHPGSFMVLHNSSVSRFVFVLPWEDREVVLEAWFCHLLFFFLVFVFKVKFLFFILLSLCKPVPSSEPLDSRCRRVGKGHLPFLGFLDALFKNTWD